VSTFLQLVNDVERESGTVSQSQRLTTVVGASGRQEKIVAWVREAWDMIQRERQDWTFHRKRFSAILTIGDTSYSAADFAITDFGKWCEDEEGGTPYSIYDTATGRGDETLLRLIPSVTWVNRWDIGLPDNNRPIEVALGYDRQLNFGPPPDKAYTVRGWYHRSHQILSADSDEPISPADHHRIIVDRALMLLAQHDEAGDAYAAAVANYRIGLNALVRACLPEAELS
jgi:hypothetical protein